MADRTRSIVRSSGTRDPGWEAWYPHSAKQRLGFPVCEQCGIAVDYLVLESDVTDEEIQKELEDLRDWILYISDHGHHRLPITGQLAPGQQPPR